MVAKTGRLGEVQERRAAAGECPFRTRRTGEMVDPGEHPWGHPRGNAVYRACDLLVKVAAENRGHQRRAHHGREPVAVLEPDALLDLHSEVDGRVVEGEDGGLLAGQNRRGPAQLLRAEAAVPPARHQAVERDDADPTGLAHRADPASLAQP